MRSRLVLALGLAALAGCRRTPPPPDVVAESRSGPVRLEEVEAAMAAVRISERAAGRQDPAAAPEMERYRKAAETLVVERAILAEVPDKDKALDELGDEHQGLYREAVLDLFQLEQDRVKPLRIEEKDVRAYYDAHRKEFYRTGARLVWHLFRRHEDRAHPEATVAFLASLKKRAEAGEAFSLLARQYSQSETRLMDGRLGTVGRGKLPKPLEDVVFSLPKGGVSNPIPVSGGAILLSVSDVVEEKQFPFEDVRLIIARRVWEKKRQDRVAEAVGGTRPPEGSIVLDAEALRRQLESADPAEVVLRIGARKLTAREFKELMEKERLDERESLPAPPLLERMRSLYEGLRQEALLFTKLEAEGFAKAPQRERILRERVRNQGLQLVVRRRIEERIWKKVDAASDALKRFHQENRFLYQSPLRLEIKTLTAGGAEFPKKAAQMEALRESLVKGQIDLETAARRIGGQVVDNGWLEPAAINAMEPKVRAYLLEMNGPGYTVPFQLNRRLNLIRVEKRAEPHLLPYEEVKDRVRQDYRDRHQQDLYQEVVAELLRAQGFRFHEEAVKRSLTVSVPAPASP